jgi:hypothetical protein
VSHDVTAIALKTINYILTSNRVERPFSKYVLTFYAVKISLELQIAELFFLSKRFKKFIDGKNQVVWTFPENVLQLVYELVHYFVENENYRISIETKLQKALTNTKVFHQESISLTNLRNNCPTLYVILIS